MIKPVVAVLIALSASTVANASPADWRTPDRDAAFAKEFSEESIQKFERLLGDSSDNTARENAARAGEARRQISRLVQSKPETVFNTAGKICDERAFDTPRPALVSAMIKGIRASKTTMHPLTVRYVAENLVNASILFYCPSLKDW